MVMCRIESINIERIHIFIITQKIQGVYKTRNLEEDKITSIEWNTKFWGSGNQPCFFLMQTLINPFLWNSTWKAKIHDWYMICTLQGAADLQFEGIFGLLYRLLCNLRWPFPFFFFFVYRWCMISTLEEAADLHLLWWRQLRMQTQQ